MQSPARRGRSCCYWQARRELKYVSSFASLQTAPAGRTVPSSTPPAKRKKLQEAAKCVQLLELCPGEAAQLLLQERQKGGSSTARPPQPSFGCSPAGFDCTDMIPLQIRCCIWSPALLPVIKGVKLCHGLNSAVAANFFLSTLNCPGWEGS